MSERCHGLEKRGQTSCSQPFSIAGPTYSDSEIVREDSWFESSFVGSEARVVFAFPGSTIRSLIAAAVMVVAPLSLTHLLAIEKTDSSKPDAPAKSASKPVANTAKPPLGQITVLVPKKTFKTEGSNKAIRLNFDDLDIEKVLNTKTVSLDLPKQMPDWLKKLDGERVRLRGYMHPGAAFQDTGLNHFILCRDTSVCCFGPNPTVYYLVQTSMKAGATANYIENKQFDVEGILRIRPEQTEGTDMIDQFYFLENAEIIRR